MVNSPFQYQLRAAVTHYGSHGNGHYVCYRSHPRITPKSEDNEAIENPSVDDEDAQDEKEQRACDETTASAPSEQWWRFSDDSVYPVSEEEAHQGNVFMLFYERIDDSTPAPSQPAQENATAIAEDAPLPPADVTAYTQISPDEEAISLALPEDDDDDLLDLIPASSPQDPGSPPQFGIPPTEATPDSSPITTPSSQPASSQTSASDSNDNDDMESNPAPSTQLTSDYESEANAYAPTPPKSVLSSPPPSSKVSPNTMRTAGNAASGRGGRKRQSLPLVSAT